MDRRSLVLAALSPARGQAHRPVQVQKLFFLIDQEIPKDVGGPHFAFEAYNYGPFDKAVYQELDALAAEGYVAVLHENKWRDYALTQAGQTKGELALSELPAPAQNYIRQASEFVRGCTFSQLVSAIYKAYPEMRANSVFQE